MAKKASRWLRRAARVATALLVVLVLLISGGLLALPHLASAQINGLLAGHWPGRAQLRWAWVDLSGALHVSELSITDTQSRTWLHVPSAQVHLRWTGFNPSISEVALSHAECQLHFRHGQLDVKLPKPQVTSPALPSELPLIRLDDFQVELTSEQGPEFHMPGLFMLASPAQQGYALTLRQEVASTTSPPLSATCQLDLAHNTVQGQLQWQHNFTAQECQALLAALGGQDFSSDGGSVALSAQWNGSMESLDKLEHSATLDVSWARVSYQQGEIVSDVRFYAHAQDGQGQIQHAAFATGPGTAQWRCADFDYDLSAGRVRVCVPLGRVDLARTASSGQFWDKHVFGGYDIDGWGTFSGAVDFDTRRKHSLTGYARSNAGALDVTAPARGSQKVHLGVITWKQLDLANQRIELVGLKGQLLGGAFNANASLMHWSKRDAHFELDFDARKMSLFELEQLAGMTASDRRGTMDARLQLAGPLDSIDTAKGRLMATVRDADFWSVPILGGVFRSLGWPAELTGLSSARFVFHLGEPVVKIVHGLIGSHLGGIEVLRGTYDPHTDVVDADIVGTTFVSVIPVARAFVYAIGRNLLVQHVHGKVSDSRSLKFTSLPISEIPRGSLAMLSDLALHGGRVGTGLLQPLEAMYNALHNSFQPLAP